MNAINLIPADNRRQRVAVATSAPTLALLGGLVLALVAVVLYVGARNDVSTQRTRLARVTAAVSAWSAAASRYGQTVHTSQQHAQELADIRQLANGRFPWSHLLGQLGSLMPAGSALNSMQASTIPGATPAIPPTPTVQLAGCARSQPLVAQTMVALRGISGVTAVTLSSATDSGSSSGSGGAGGCHFPVQFQISLAFAPAAAVTRPAASAASTSPGAATGPSTTTSTSTTGSAGTAAAAAPATPTAAAQ